MKKNILLYMISVTFLMTLFSCDQEDGDFDNSLYIIMSEKTESILLKGNNTDRHSFTVQMLKPMSEAVILDIKANADRVNDYNVAYSTTATLLEGKYYTISPAETQIEPTSVTSVPITVAFQNLNELDRESLYVLPVTVTSRTLPVTGSKNTIFYVLKGAALINVVANIEESATSVTWTKGEPLQAMKTFTAEALIRPSSFPNMIASLMGIEGEFLLRYGDAGIPGNQLQIATSSGNFTDASLQVATNVWTHVAMTYDADAKTIEVYYNGKKAFSTSNANIGPVSWNVSGNDGFWIGRSYDDNRPFFGDISEVRVWNKVLTSDEINATNHFYGVDANSEGLIAYWKFDEGGGTAIKDYSVNANNAVAKAGIKWVSVELPENE